MAEYSTGAYFISRKRKVKGGRRAVGFIITALLLLTAAICALVFLLPRGAEQAAKSASFGGRTFYLLATDETDVRADALVAAQNTAARGGAGYVFNDGKYRVIAAAYKSKTDAQSLADVNDGAFVVELALSACDISGGDLEAVRYMAGELFDALYNAASELERGFITEAAADNAAKTACMKLARLADGAKTPSVRLAAQSSAEYAVPSGMTVKSYIRYVSVRAVVLLAEAVS